MKLEIPTPDHVALLVRSVKRAADHLATLGFHIGEPDEFEGEGTREIYVEKDKANSLLHPMSIQTLKHKTADLARPGFPALIEVQQRPEPQGREIFVTEVSVPFDSSLNGLLKPIALSKIL